MSVKPKIGDWVELNETAQERYVILSRRGDIRAKIQAVGRKWFHVTTSGGVLLRLRREDFSALQDG